MATTSDLGLHPIRFAIEQLPSCCGIGVIHAFFEAKKWDTPKGGPSWQRVEVPGNLKSLEEQAKECYAHLLTKVGDDGFTTFVIALTEDQFPTFQKVLEQNGWGPHHNFQNPNTSRFINFYSKHFPEAVEQWKMDREDEEYD